MKVFGHPTGHTPGNLPPTDGIVAPTPTPVAPATTEVSSRISWTGPVLAAAALGAIGFTAYCYARGSENEGMITRIQSGFGRIFAAAPLPATEAPAAPMPLAPLPTAPVAIVVSPLAAQTSQFTARVRYLANKESDLQNLDTKMLSSLIADTNAQYPLLSKEVRTALFIEAFSSRKEDVTDLITKIEDERTIQAEIEQRQKELQDRMVCFREQLVMLRGPTGFDGTINAAWVTYFDSWKEEAKLIMSLCKVLAGEPGELSPDELCWINGIYPSSETNIIDLEDLLSRFRARIPLSFQATTNEEVFMHAESKEPTLTKSYTALRQTKETNEKAYHTLHADYESIGGKDFNPDIDQAKADSHLQKLSEEIDRVPASVRESYSGKAIFWRSLKETLTQKK